MNEQLLPLEALYDAVTLMRQAEKLFAGDAWRARRCREITEEILQLTKPDGLGLAFP